MDKKSFKYACLFFFTFDAIGVFVPYLGQYLSSIGFLGTQIGTITSAGTATAIIAQGFWGSRYNRRDNKKLFVLKLIVMAAAICFSLHFVESYFLFLLMYCFLYFFQPPILALIDALVIEDGMVFGKVRKWGAVGFAIAVFLSGRIVEVTGLSVIFFLYVGCFIVSAGVLFAM